MEKIRQRLVEGDRFPDVKGSISTVALKKSSTSKAPPLQRSTTEENGSLSEYKVWAEQSCSFTSLSAKFSLSQPRSAVEASAWVGLSGQLLEKQIFF